MSLSKNLSVFTRDVNANGTVTRYTSNAYFQETVLNLGSGDVSNNWLRDNIGSNSYNQATYAANSYLTATFTSNNYMQGVLSDLDSYTSNSYIIDTYAANSYLTATFTSNNYMQDLLSDLNSYASNNYVQDTFTSNTYFQEKLANANFVELNTAGLNEYQFTNTTANNFAIPGMDSNTTVQVWKSGIKLSNTLWSALKLNTTHVYLVDTPQTNDTISILTYTPNTYNLKLYANDMFQDIYVTNTYLSDAIVINDGKVGIGTTTPNTALQLQGGVGVGSVTSGTGNTTWNVTTHQTAIITTGHGNTDVTISNANDIPIGTGLTLLVDDTGKSTNLNISLSGVSPAGVKYPSATAPTINSANGETLIIGLISLDGAGQLVASSVMTVNTA